MRRFDHAVLCVADLDRAREKFAALGFTLTPPARHPFGTANSLVQFANHTFLELLAIADPKLFPAALPAQFNFAAFNRDFLQRRGEGMSMLVFSSDDASADIDAFRAAGLQTYTPFDFGRDAVLPDGSVARVQFSLAFVTHAHMPDAAFFTCQHRHPPDLFWRTEYQTHANGVQGLAEVVMSAAQPGAPAGFFQALTGETPRLTPDGGELTVGPPANRLAVRRSSDPASPHFSALRLEGGAAPSGHVTRIACGVTLHLPG